VAFELKVGRFEPEHMGRTCDPPPLCSRPAQLRTGLQGGGGRLGGI
jgi:hypothetical protein